MDVKVKMEDGAVIWDDGIKMETKGEPSADDDDPVFREIEVYLAPSIDSDTKLYLLQYPLRPYWRPYNLEERSTEVRVKHQHNKLEVDLVLDNDGPNFNAHAEDHLKIERQTLTSTQGNLSTNCAVGILEDNKLYLHPLHAIVQLRPSLKYLDEAEAENKKSIGRVESDDEMPDTQPEAPKSEPIAFKVQVKKQETERQQQSRLMSYAHLKQLEEAEPWIPLEPHGFESPLTQTVTKKIKGAADAEPAPRCAPNAALKAGKRKRADDYLKKLVPGRSPPTPVTNPTLSKEPLSKSYLDTLPLDKKLRTVFTEGRVHVLPFERIMKLVAGCPEEDVLAVLQKTALLVQGCWVATSQMRYEGSITILRDYILSLFVRNTYIDRETLAELRVTKDVLREILQPIAIQNVKSEAWEFIESTDKTFIKKHPGIVKQQMQKWAEVEDGIKMNALALQKPSIGSRINLALDPNGALPETSFLPRAPSSMSPETLAALPGALREIFLKHQVCNLQLIRQSLENLAIKKAQEDCNPQERAAVAAAGAAAKAPVADLTLAVSQVATCIKGVFFLTRLDDPALDPFREVVIALLRLQSQTEPGAGLVKAKVNEAFQNALHKQPTQPVYHKVMKEFCYTRGATWFLKTGDGRPNV